MGIPYSRQINAAFNQVTPLVAEGFVVLQTTKNISLLLAVIQILTVIFLALIFIVLFAIAVTLNPALQQETEDLITPTLRRLLHLYAWLLSYQKTVATLFMIISIGVAIGSALGLYYTSRDPTLVIEDSEAGDEVFGDESGTTKLDEVQQ